MMGIISPYCSDEETVASLRQQFDRDEQYRINFYHALHTAHRNSEGIVVCVKNRSFLLHPILGLVVRELFDEGGTC